MAAARVLTRNGFQNVSMADIAREAGFTAPALYLYFESKERILDELVRWLGTELMATFDEAIPPGLSFRQALAVLLGRQLAWADRRRDVFVAFFALRVRGEVPGGQSRAQCDGHGPRRFHARLTDWMRAADPRGRRGDTLGDHDPAEAASVLMGITQSFFMRWIAGDLGGTLADHGERILDLFFHGVLGSVRHRRATR